MTFGASDKIGGEKPGFSEKWVSAGARALLIGCAALLLTLVDAQDAMAHAARRHTDQPGVIGPRGWDELWRTWELEPGVVIPLALSALLYGCGVWHMWRSAGVGRGIRKWEAASFAAGWLTLIVALVPRFTRGAACCFPLT